jgi:NTE family protein
VAGVKGAAHIGVLKAMEEENIKYDYISGASSGSIVAALAAMGYSADEIYKLFKKQCRKINGVELKNVLKLIWGLIVYNQIIIEGLNSGEKIEKIVNEAGEQKGIYNISQIKSNLLIPSVDLNDGGLYMFSSMLQRGAYSDEIKYINDISIGKAVRASCSYPGVFSPCKFEDKELIDGGIRENLPWKETKRNGADIVFCVKFENEKKEKCRKNIIDNISKSIDILCHELSNYEIEGIDYLLTLKTKNISLLDYSKIDELYELGYVQAKKYLKDKKRHTFLKNFSKKC